MTIILRFLWPCEMAQARSRYAKRYGAALAQRFGDSVGGILVDGEVNAETLDSMFDQFDADGDG